MTPEIEKLIKDGVIQLSLFDERLAGISTDGIRYILCRNPARANKIADICESKLNRLKKLITQQNTYLAEHPRAKVEVALRKVHEKSKVLKLNKWVSVEADGRILLTMIDEAKKSEESRLDGCCVIKTDLSADIASTQTVHNRYKYLSEVEFAFRTMKTVLSDHP